MSVLTARFCSGSGISAEARTLSSKGSTCLHCADGRKSKPVVVRRRTNKSDGRQFGWLWVTDSAATMAIPRSTARLIGADAQPRFV